MWAATVATILATGASQVRAVGNGHSFNTFLYSGFTQELFGVSGDLGNPDDFPILGGVAFAENGDVWSSECLFFGTRLHRFHAGEVVNVHDTDIHPEEAPIQTEGGCGLANHPDGALYSNSSQGIWKLDAATGLPLGNAPFNPLPHAMGPGGNALGIAVDPQTHHLVYVGGDCHPSLNLDPDNPSTTCTLWDLDPQTEISGVFARLPRTELELLDGIYFDPSGEYLFAAHRDAENNSLRIIHRPDTLGAANLPATTDQLVNDIPMTAEPDGVAFHATEGFVVTLNESDEGNGGTMTRFDFGGNFTSVPSPVEFASGGFRGDLLQVGADGCVYATQGSFFGDFGPGSAVRYNDDFESTDNSIVKICGGFVPPPGVEPPAGTGVIGDFVWNDLDRDGVQDGGEPGLDGQTVTLTGGSLTDPLTTTTHDGGQYTFTALKAGTYQVAVGTPADMVASPSGAGGDASLDSNGSPANVTLAEDSNQDLTIDFGFYTQPAKVSGFAYVDTNPTNSVKDALEDGLQNVLITLTRTSGGSFSATQLTGLTGAYQFTALDPGAYDVSAADPASGKKLHTASPLNVTLAAGDDRTDVNFGYVPGSIAGFAYIDVNHNSVKDDGEAGLGGVVISRGIAVTTTAGDGSYSFLNLDAGPYGVSAPASASGYDLFTPSPLSVTLLAGQNQPDVNFGYVAQVVAEIPQCSKATVQSVLDPATGRYPANRGPDQIVRFDLNQSVQGAINNISDSNDDGYLIILVLKDGTGALGGDRTESIEIAQYYSKPFALFGCSVTLHDASTSNGKPTARVTTSAGSAGALGNIYVMDVHAADSEAEGWRVEGNGRYLRNVEARGNAVGIRFVGNSNTMYNGAVENNFGIGLAVQGNSNIVTDTDAFKNSGHGVQVIGSSNQVLKVDSGDKNKGNGGDGVHVEGAGNLLQENDAFANGGDGIELVASSGSPNIIKKSRSGDKSGLANAGNGILVAGPGNGTASPIELEENTVKANGLVGIRITGTGHQLKNNVSGGSGSGETNVGCEFNAAGGNVNATGNKANGTTVAGSNGSAFITGCVGSS